MSINRAADTYGIFAGIPDSFVIGRYHSLYAIREKLPSCLKITAQTKEGLIMAVQHESLPMAAVQFHPESILTAPGHGVALLSNAATKLRF